MKKKKLVRPDEVISLGAIEVARYGKNIVWNSNWTKDQHEKMLQNRAEQYSIVVKEIDELVNNIVSAVQRLPPEQLLYRAWTNLALSSLHIEVEADVGMEDAHAMRMVDYVQSIIASSPPNLEQQDEVSEEDWQYLSAQVEELFRKINFEYPVCATAKRKLLDDDFDDARGCPEFCVSGVSVIGLASVLRTEC